MSNATGNGTVYLSTSSTSNSGQTGTTGTAGAAGSTSYITWNCGGSSGSDSKTYYARGTANAGYYYAGWATSSTATSYTAATTGWSPSKATSTNSGSPTTSTIYGFFKAVTVTGVSNVTIDVTDKDANYPAEPGTISFTTANSNALTDFTYTPAAGTTGKFTFSDWTRASASSTTVKYQFKGDGTWGGVARTITQNVTLTSKGTGGGSATCTITVNYPNVRVVEVDTESTPTSINATYKPADATQAGVDRNAVFNVEYCDGTNNFDTPTFTGAGASHFTYNSMSYANGKLTVNYTYNGNKEEGTHVATLTLKGKDAIGGTDATYGSKSVTITAENAPEAMDDAKVIASDGITKIYQGNWATALSTANDNAGCTLKLLRNVTGLTASQEVKNTMTLDLASYELSGTLSAAGGLIKLNTGGKILTINDSYASGGGKISVSGNLDGRISAVDIQKGSLVLSKGDLIATNAHTGTTQANIYCATVYLAASTTMSMTNGTITANRTGASGKYCYGIYCAGSGSTAASVNLTGGTIEANFANGSYAEGVYSTGTSLSQNMTINASAKQYSYAFWVEDGHLAINGGTYTGTTSTNGARAIYNHTTPATKNALVVNNATLNATSGTTDAKGLYCESRSSTTTDDPLTPNIVLSNVTITAKTEGASATTGAYAIYTKDAGICLAVNSGTYNATAKTGNAYGIYSSGYSAVKNGTFTVNATTTEAYGIYVAASIAAVQNGTFSATAVTDKAYGANILSGAKLLVYGGSFTGHLSKVGDQKFAVGAYVAAGGTLEAQGGSFLGTAANATITAEQKAYACGVYSPDGASTISMSNATMRGELQSTYLTNGGASTWSGGAYGFYARSTNPLGLTNCAISANSAYQGGFGIRFANTPAEVKNCTVTVTTTKAYNYGIFVGGNTCNVKLYECDFTCTSGTTYAYGIWAYNGTTYAENCIINATVQRTSATSAADCNLFGVKVEASKTATLNGCTITATGSGSLSNNGYGVHVNGTADIEDCTVTVSGINSGAYAICNSANTTRIGVASGKFKATATSTGISCNGTADAAKQKLYGGYYNTINNLEKYLPEGYGIETLPTTAAEYAEGYRYAIRSSANIDPVCKIGSTPYITLEEALEFVNKNSGTSYTILMVKNYTLPAGDYTLPAKATLLVPYNSDQTSAVGTGKTGYVSSYVVPSRFRKLTFADGVNMTVFGTIEVSAEKYLTSSGATGIPSGPYGQIVLEGNAHIDLEENSKLVAWGYVTGSGDINAKNKSSIYEMFQLLDMKGGGVTSQLINDSRNPQIFPITHYAYQNVEATITYRPGSKAIGWTGANVQSSNQVANDVMMVGNMNSGALFLMADEGVSSDTWVRKHYDPTTDRAEYTLNNTATLGNINVNLSSINMASAGYILPIASNMTITLKYGTMTITQNTYFMPGSILNIEKESTLTIPSGKELYFVDKNQWVKGYAPAQYVCVVPYSPSFNSNKGGEGKTYSPRKGLMSSNTNLPPAELFAHGDIVVDGALYTTADGANIHSTNADAGKITFNSIASNKDFCQLNSTCGEGAGGPGGSPGGAKCEGTLGKIEKLGCTTGVCDCYYWNWNTWPCTSAQLKNESGFTSSVSGGSGTYVYKNDAWTKVAVEGCFTTETDGSGKHYYATPSDVVEVTRNADNSYRDVASGFRRFVWDVNCEWWEVETTPTAEGYYKSITADHNGRYNYYEYNSTHDYWEIKNITITWSVNGSTTNYTIGYGTHPKYLSANPTKTATASEYYTWIGWAKGSAEGEFFAKDAELPEATETTTYYALFETHKYSYAVTFKNYDGSVLQATSWEAGQVPYYMAETDPVKPATAALVYTFTGWSPATFTAVTGSGDVYTAQFDAGTTRTYTVQWVNYNGTVLKEEQVAYGTTPSAPVTPTRPNDAFYTYTFNSWTPAITSVTGNQTYTATYDYSQKVTKYDITFKNGSTTMYTQSLPNGETPVYGGSEPTKDDAQYTYTFDGWSNTDGGEKLTSLPAVNGAAKTYYAVFTHVEKKYTIRWKSEDGKQTLETDYNVPYGTAPSYNGATPTKPRQGATIYTFDGWSSSIGGDKIALPNVSGHATYYAHFSNLPVYTVTFDVKGHGSAPANQEVVSGETVTEPAAPTAAGYTFGGWYKEPGCTNAWNFSTDVVNENKTLYAKWTANTYYVRFNKNHANATGTMSNETFTYGTSKALTTNAFSRTGYTFAGWATTADGSVTYSDGQSVSNLTSTAGATVDLYAKWTCVSPSGLSIASEGDKWDFCAGETMTLTVSGSNIAADATYQWKRNGSNIAGATSASYTKTMTRDDAGTYTCTVTNGSCSTTTSGYDVKVWTFYHNASGSFAHGNLTFSSAGIGTISITLTAGETYEFKLNNNMSSDNWFGNTGTMTTTIPDGSAWTFGSSISSNCHITAGMGGSYVFKVNYSDSGNPKVSVTYPTANQPSGSKIWFDKSIIADWGSNVYYRVGKSSHNSNQTLSLVPGTDQFYEMTTNGYDGFEAWQIANNTSWSDDNSIYLVNGSGYEITKATNFQKYAIDASGITIVPTTSNNTENGCNYWNVSTSTGMLTHKATITTPTNGTITIANANQGLSATATTANLPHRTILTITATPNSGYRCASLTVNGVEFTSGSTHILSDDATIAATFVVDVVDKELDIVDWTNSSIKINVTNFKTLAGTNDWKIRVNETDYARNACNTTTRTLTVSDLSLTPDETLLIQVKNGSGVVESQHNYTIPKIYTENATLSGTTETSIVYVYGGKLTISGNTELAALYVCPGAEVEVTNGTLTVGRLVLRTKPWATAAISGNVSATETYYTRIAPDGQDGYTYGQYYQFGLPYACAISAVRLSDGTTPAYNTTWLLKSYNEERRAEKGTTENNWDALASDATIVAGRGYEMMSTVKYYREYYFRVTPTDNKSVDVTRHGDDKNNSGWNIVCSPLMSVYKNTSNPVDGLKVSWLLADGSYDQVWPETIWPAMPFSYQASANGTLDFSTSNFNQTVSAAPRRAAYDENVESEWIHLDARDVNGVGDHTSIFVHPNRFTETYETGIDVAKQSLTASRAILYSSHAYGDMAFAGVSDSLLEKGVALTVYSPRDQELTISMRENEWLNRMAAVWLIDHETGVTTDLLWNDYSFDAVSGTMRGRFAIQGIFRAPGVATSVEDAESSSQKSDVRKVIMDQKIYIMVNGRLYDSTGKLVNLNW
ncbi:MAG: InlB B-repeat-containing protein [Paludibacteraceae bacterium]|nr:InlB B-repeat-containing protein [Paludibacteraceae bacterium]MBR6492643.1 InlB B-repeat-containing protein [Paludibacteraceae bacterium]